MKKMTVAIMILAMLALTGCLALPLAVMDSERGSGVIVEQEYDFTDFSQISIGSAFSGDVVAGDEWRVVISADDNILPHIEASQSGDKVTIGVEPGFRFTSSQVRVDITMPALELIELSGAANIRISGFDGAGGFEARLSGASELEGDVSAANFDVSLSGASDVELAGSGEELSLIVNGASNARLEGLQVTNADVRLSGAANAYVTATDGIELEASGASTLEYGGGARLNVSTLSGGSKVVER